MNLYAYAGNNPITFTDPFGLCPKQVEKGTICLDFFIQRSSVLGFRGDGRGFDPEAPLSASRVQVLITPDGNVSIDGSPSCDKNGCTDFSKENSARISRSTNGSFTVSVTATNSRLPDWAPGKIDATITFTPDGKGSYDVEGARDNFPSLGIYQNSGEKWETMKERPGSLSEYGPYWLLAPVLVDRW